MRILRSNHWSIGLATDTLPDRFPFFVGIDSFIYVFLLSKDGKDFDFNRNFVGYSGHGRGMSLRKVTCS